MQPDSDRAVARRYFTDAWNERNPAVLDEIFTPTFTRVTPDANGQEAPVSAVADTIERWHDAFAGYRYDINHEATIEDGTVLFFTTYSGTHTGVFRWRDYGPSEPTGRAMSGYQAFAFALADERITRMASVWDPAIFASQLGVAR